MLSTNIFFSILEKEGIDFFTGVPDSYLNDFCNYLDKNISKEKNIITANEGNAVALASGYNISTGKIPVVYMQNSGMGNALNPLVSLADKNVYGTPMVLLIGWRGKEGVEPDHPQHKRQGEITLKLLEIMGIPYVILEENKPIDGRKLCNIINKARETESPVAVVAEKGVFSLSKKNMEIKRDYPLTRGEAIQVLLDLFSKDTIFVATTGRASRELYFLREERGEGHEKDFLNIGAMGHASSVAMGLALNSPNKEVVCLDGDAALIMHMGSMAVMGRHSIPNMLHIVLNNGVHESVGGQVSSGHYVNMTQIAENSGYETVGRAVSKKEEIIGAVSKLKDRKKAGFIDIKISKGMSSKLPPLPSSCTGTLNELRKEILREG